MCIDKTKKSLVLISVLIVYLLGALDLTILSTATPTIVADLSGMEFYAWINISYMLTSTALIPVIGKAGDIYGRKEVFVVGIMVFVLGSLLCSLSGLIYIFPLPQSGILQLVLFRGVAGVGGAIIFTTSLGLIADLYAPKQRAKVMGYLGAAFALATAIGPPLGGMFTDYARITSQNFNMAGWRWIFLINVPLGILALFLVLTKLPRLFSYKRGSINYLESFVIIAIIVPLSVFMANHGATLTHSDSIYIFPFVSLIFIFIYIFKYSVRPDSIMPRLLFRNPTFVLVNLSSCLLGMAFMGAIMFMPLYVQSVLRLSATESGLCVISLMVGLMFGAAVSGKIVSSTGKYKIFFVSGAILQLIGSALLSKINHESTSLEINAIMGLIGVGLGPIQSLVNPVAQNAFSDRKIGVVTGSTHFFRQVSNTLGISLFGAMLVTNLSDELSQIRFDTSEDSILVKISEAQKYAMHSSTMAHTERVEEIEGSDNKYMDGFRPHAVNERLNSENYVNFRHDSGVNKADLSDISYGYSFINPGEKETKLIYDMSIRLAFSNSITKLFSAAFWIVLIGCIVTIFIPAIPLKDKENEAVI